MCIDPVSALAFIKTATASIGATMGTLGTVASVGGGVISAYSQVQNSKAQAAAATRTAQAQDVAALQAIEQGEQESDKRRRAGAALQAENTVGMAANGIDVGSAQALDVLDDGQFLIEEDAFTIRENSRRSGTGMAQAAANSRADAQTARSNATFAPIKTMLTTAATVGNKYASWVPDARSTQGSGGYA
jgi:hypothetical protein